MTSPRHRRLRDARPRGESALVYAPDAELEIDSSTIQADAALARKGGRQGVCLCQNGKPTSIEIGCFCQTRLVAAPNECLSLAELPP
jgi:hypothetical protein